MEPEESDTPMREVVFHVLADCPGHLAARAERPPITIAAPSFEELQHEAREALIQHFGPAHAAYRVRLPLHRSLGSVVSWVPEWLLPRPRRRSVSPEGPRAAAD